MILALQTGEQISNSTHKYLWYCGINKRIAAEGTGSQDAFSRLNSSDRQVIATLAEFCVVITDPRQLNASYWELRALPRA